MTSSRIGILIVFFLHGTGAGTWIGRIPAIQEHLDLGVGSLGLALLGAGLGTLLAMVPTGALIAQYGSRAIVLWTAWPAALTLVLPGLAPHGAGLFVALVIWGASTSALDVAMNAQGSAVEQRLGRPIMSSLHGFWSLGNMSGAAIGALLAGAGVPAQVHLILAAPVLLLGFLAAGRSLLPGDAGQGAGGGFARPRGALLALAVVAFCAVTVEGAMFDWAGVYLRQVLVAPEAGAAAAAGFFAAAMAGGRLGGDLLTARVRASRLARACALVASLGLVAIVVAPALPLVYGGLIAVGLGLSILVPLAFGAAGRSVDSTAGAAIAAVATMGYLGFLLGPPTIGLAAEIVGLRAALAMLLVLLVVVALLASAVGDQRVHGRAQATPPGGFLDP